MAKYSYEFKKKVVEEYLSGGGGYKYLARKYAIASQDQLHRWVAAYQALGPEGLVCSRKNNTYTLEFKLHVVELYLTSELSYQQLALSEGMNNPALIIKWVNDFRIAGVDALRPRKKGRRSKMSKPKENSEDLNSEYLKQLEEENLRLRIENAYLKELRRLRIEQIAQKKKRESSTASEENSD